MIAPYGAFVMPEENRMLVKVEPMKNEIGTSGCMSG